MTSNLRSLKNPSMFVFLSSVTDLSNSFTENIIETAALFTVDVVFFSEASKKIYISKS